MKVRSGFVSNSSSSSFVVAADNANKLKTTLTIELDLSKYANHVITSEKQLIDYFQRWGSVPTENENDWNMYRTARKAIDAGKIVYLGSFSDESDDPVEVMLCRTGIKGKINDKEIMIIVSEEGY